MIASLREQKMSDAIKSSRSIITNCRVVLARDDNIPCSDLVNMVDPVESCAMKRQMIERVDERHLGRHMTY